MIGSDFAELQLFITGPILLRKEVREAGLLPEFGHRDSENIKRFGPIMENLRKIANAPDDYEVIVFNGSGTNVLEASICSLVARDDTVLNVSVGAFGDLYHTLALTHGKNAVQLKFDYGRAIDLDKLEEALDEYSPEVVTFTQNETSTGVINNVPEVCALISKYGAKPLVDAVSIFGGTPSTISESRPLMYSTSTQKALGLPAGFGIAFISPEGFEKAQGVENRGYTTDILAQREKARNFQTLTTPNGTLVNQMCVQLDFIVNDETVEKRFARHDKMRDIAHAWVEGMDGYSLFAQEGYRSPSMTAVQTAPGMSIEKLKQVKEIMRGYGYLFDPGYGRVNKELEESGKQPIFRIGHMGDIQPAMLEKYLDTLGEVLKGM